MIEDQISTLDILELKTLLQSLAKELNTTRWFTTREAAEHLRISERSVRRAMERGKLKYARFGDGKRGSIRFTGKWLDAYALGYNGGRLTPSQKTILTDLS
jgi:excisionase family DNA binding protein